MTENKTHEQGPHKAVEASSFTSNTEKPDTVAPTNQPQKNAQTITNNTSKWFIPLSLLLSTSALAVSGWLYYQSTQNTFDQNIKQLTIQQSSLNAKLNSTTLSQSQLDKLIQEVKTLKQSNQAQEAKAALEQTKLNEQLQSFEAKLNRLNNTTKEDWKLAEAEYLIRLANQRLLLESDSKAAAALLNNADDILNEVQDPIVFNTRKALAKDIQALNATSQFDLEGAYLQLNALYDSLESLPQQEPSKAWQASTQETSTSAESTSEETSSTTGKIKSTLHSFWQSIRSLVIINYNQKPIKTLLPPAKYQELITGLQLQLDVAQMALIKGEPTIYQQALSRVHDAIIEHFETQSESVVSFLSSLASMQKLNPAPELPQPRESLMTIKSLMEDWTSRGPKEALPPPSEDMTELTVPEDETPNSESGDKV